MKKLSRSLNHAPQACRLVLLLLLAGLGACGSGGKVEETPTAASEQASEQASAQTGAAQAVAQPAEPEATMPAQLQDGRLKIAFQPIPLPASPGGLAVQADTIWVTGPEDGSIAAVDVNTGTARTLNVGGEPTALAFFQDALWVMDASSDYWVRRIDPETGDTLADVQPPPGVYPGPRRLAAGNGAIWASVDGTGALLPIDPASGTAAEVITDRPNLSAGGDAPLFFAFGSVWVIDSNEGRLLRIDPASGQIVATIQDLGYEEKKEGDSREFLADGPTALAASADGLWVLSDVANRLNPSQPNVVGSGALFRIDPATNQVSQRLELNAEADKRLDPALVVADGIAWYADMESGNVVRVDLATGQEVMVVPLQLAISPTGIAVVGDMVWVAGWTPSGNVPLALFGVDRQTIAGILSQGK